jgi:hypothetical protein
MYGPSILDNLSYFRVEDTYEMSSVKFLSPMETDPPILPLSPPPANPSPIVGRVLNFDSMDYAAPLQPCSHPRGEDTCLTEIRPDSEDCTVDVPESEGLGTFKDPTGLEAALRNSSLDVCKDVLPHRGSSHDDDEDRGQDRREGGQTGNHARVIAVDSVGASGNPFSNSGRVSGHGGDEPLADKEGRMEDDLVDYESDPYESAMRDHPEAANDSVFRVEYHSRDPNTPEDNYASCASPYIMFGFFFVRFIFPRDKDTCSCFSVSIVCLIFIVSMIGIVRHQELVVWMPLHRVLSLN